MVKKKTEKKTDVSKDVEEEKKDDAKRFDKSNALLVVGGLVFGLLIGLVITSPWITGAAVSTGDVSAEITELFPQVTVSSVEDLGSVYMVSFTAMGQPGTSFVTKDGAYMIVGQAINLGEVATEAGRAAEPEPAGGEAEEADIPKTDRPEVEVFVMSYCPYGLQMEKAVLPVQELLGDYADISIKFVHYIMHGEKEATENTRQYCIQKEEPDKFWDYMECFVDDGEGNEQSCMTSAGIAPKPIAACVIAAKKEFGVDEDLASEERFPRFGIDADASSKYGVRGSPALVINGQLVEASRTPDGVKTAVCDAFTTAPVECETALSTSGAQPGFGLTGAATSGNSDATCG